MDVNDIAIFKEVMEPVIASYRESQNKNDNIKAEKIMKWLGISVEKNKEASTDMTEPADQKQPDKPLLSLFLSSRLNAMTFIALIISGIRSFATGLL